MPSEPKTINSREEFIPYTPQFFKNNVSIYDTNIPSFNYIVNIPIVSPKKFTSYIPQCQMVLCRMFC